MTSLADDPAVVQRLLDHIDQKTTDTSDASWREPVGALPSRRSASRPSSRCCAGRRPRSAPRRRCPRPGATSRASAAGTPLLAVRGSDGVARVFRNACRHRGTQLASGSGCAKAFMCRYHGWTYGLDGGLRHVPHEHGFPGLDKSARGLVPVAADERERRRVRDAGAPGRAIAALDELPPLIPPTLRLVRSTEQRDRGQLEDPRRGLPRGLPHPLDPPARRSTRSSSTT